MSSDLSINIERRAGREERVSETFAVIIDRPGPHSSAVRKIERIPGKVSWA